MATKNLTKLYGEDGYDQIGEVARLGRVCAFFTGRTLLNREHEPVTGFALLSMKERAVLSIFAPHLIVVVLAAAYIYATA